jgi:hypothetical protein
MGCKRDQFAETETVAKMGRSDLPSKWDLTQINDSDTPLYLFWGLYLRVISSQITILKSKFYPRTGHEGPGGRGVELQVYLFFKLGSRWGGYLAPRCGKFNLFYEQLQILIRRSFFF